MLRRTSTAHTQGIPVTIVWPNGAERA
jgi:hypothetical protein